MSQHVTIDERLSALYDGEMSSFEGKRLVSELLSNSPRKAKFLRYQMMSDVLHGEIRNPWASDFATRVMQGVESDPAYSIDSSDKSSSHPWLKPVAGFALAASVAAVSIFALQFATNEDSGLEMATAETQVEEAATTAAGQSQTLAELPQTSVTDNAMFVNTTKDMPALPDDAALLSDPRMDSYLATHAEFASRPGFLSRVRIVGYSGSSPEEKE